LGWVFCWGGLLFFFFSFFFCLFGWAFFWIVGGVSFCLFGFVVFVFFVVVFGWLAPCGLVFVLVCVGGVLWVGWMFFWGV